MEAIHAPLYMVSRTGYHYPETLYFHVFKFSMNLSLLYSLYKDFDPLVFASSALSTMAVNYLWHKGLTFAEDTKLRKSLIRS